MIVASWEVLVQLAPWLLFGTLLSGMLFVFLPGDFIRRKFRGVSGVIKSVLLGVPLPLCSCGVIPAGIGLKNQGASNGSAIGFLISTPQTGVDSILVSAAFFGWPFALFKMVAAAVTGIVGGLIADRVSAGDREVDLAVKAGDVGCADPENSSLGGRIGLFLDHCVEIIRSIWIWLAIGILVSAAIDVYLPGSALSQVGEMGLWPAMFVALLVATPLYVCATASVPIASALVAGGLPPAAALVFLMAGPATNVTTIGAIKDRFGWSVTFVYLVTITVGSMLAAWMFDALLSPGTTEFASHEHLHGAWWEIGSATILLLMMIWFFLKSVWRKLNRIIRYSDYNVEFRVEGMHCASCVERLEKELRTIDGVSQVDVALKPGVAKLAGSFDSARIIRAIESLGFKVVTGLE